ncbi:MAG: GNAT family N-acetyltransferase, partial [Lachnospiraceae bacterium]|nr:GNAT family N-acetyltransferase [Lachnospiraceae bacterium]
MVYEMRTELNYEVRRANENEWEDAMALAWRTFMRFEACDYTQEGIDNFSNFISDNGLHRMFLIGEYHLWVAVAEGKIIGMIS